MSATAWSTIASLATALGTLVLAVAFRDPERAGYEEARKVIEAHEAWTVELLYGDHEGGQRVVSRFTVFPAPVRNPDQKPDQKPGTEPRWLATASRHWNIDRPDPR